MKLRKLVGGTVLLLVIGIVGGCGTFFPKAPAERAADKVLDDVFPASDQGPGNAAKTDSKKL